MTVAACYVQVDCLLLAITEAVGGNTFQHLVLEADPLARHP